MLFLLAGALYLVVVMVFSVIEHGNILNLYVITPLRAFIFAAMGYTFFAGLVHQFVAFCLMKLAIDHLTADERTSMWELILYAAVYALFQYYSEPIFIIREYALGLILGYMYLRTRSLLPGVALSSIVWVFVL